MICYGCLSPMEDGHNAKSCKKKMNCITCNEKHATPLYGYIPKNNKVAGDWNQSQNNQEEVKSNFTDDVKCANTLGKLGSKVISVYQWV